MGAAKNAHAIALHGKAPQRAAKQTNCASSPQRCSRKALSTNFTARGNLGQGRREKHTPNAAGASDEGNRRKPHRTANKSHIKRMPTKFKRIKKITHQANEDKIQTHTTHKQSKPAPGAVRPKSRLAFSLSINDMPLQFVCLKDSLSCKQPISCAAASLIYFFCWAAFLLGFFFIQPLFSAPSAAFARPSEGRTGFCLPAKCTKALGAAFGPALRDAQITCHAARIFPSKQALQHFSALRSLDSLFGRRAQTQRCICGGVMSQAAASGGQRA